MLNTKIGLQRPIPPVLLLADHLTQPYVAATAAASSCERLCNGTVSVCPSVCLSRRQTAISTERRRLPVNDLSIFAAGGRAQKLAASCSEPMYEALRRLVSVLNEYLTVLIVLCIILDIFQ